MELQEFLQLPQALGQWVQPETRRAQGLERLRPLLRALQAGQVVEFEYYNYWEGAAETRTVGPLLLKEFRGRWYLLGQMAYGNSRHLACFGLDRIRGLRLIERPFSPPAGFDATAYYAHAFGITRPSYGKLQQVLLRFGAAQGHYAPLYPLHASQRVVRATDEEIDLTLTV